MKSMRTILLLLLCLSPVAFADGLLDRISPFGHKQPTFLDADKAFGLEVEAQDAQTLIASFQVTPKYYLYRNKVEFRVAEPDVKIARIEMPKGELKHDDNLGDMEVFHQPFQARIVLAPTGKAARTITLNATYQGCSEDGLCYPPINRAIKVSLPGAEAAVAPATTAEPPPPDNENTRIANLFRQGNFWLIISFFFGAGLLLSLTPCMYPMVPILSGIIVGRGQNITHKHGFILSFSYVLGMALTLAAIGVAAGYTGELLSNALQTPWAKGGFAAIFVLLALSMFGLYELQLPSALQSRLVGASNKLHGGHITGVFVMGVLSAIIASPCVSAPMGAAVAYVAKTHDPVLGGSAFFSMGLGMGLPLLVIGISAGTWLPKAGAWMESVKRFFGVLLLAVAIWVISSLIPVGVEMLLWAALLILSAIFLHALDALPHNAGFGRRLWKGAGVLLLLVGVAYLVGALSGARDVLRPLAMIGSAQAETQLQFTRVRNVAELDARIAQAGGKRVVLDFYADWCVSCKEMEREAFTDAKVRAKLQNAVLLQADVTANSEESRALMQRFQVIGPPATLFFDQQGKELSDFRVVGYQNAGQFLQSLQSAGL